MKRVITKIEGMYDLFVGFPCVLITTRENIITIGLIHIFSFSPLLIGIGVSKRRYSYGLLMEEREFVINIPTRELIGAVDFCGKHSGKEYDKFKETGLSREKSVRVKALSIKECPVNFECKVEQIVETGDHTWFIGKVVGGRVDENYRREDGILYWGGRYRLPGSVIRKREG